MRNYPHYLPARGHFLAVLVLWYLITRFELVIPHEQLVRMDREVWGGRAEGRDAKDKQIPSPFCALDAVFLHLC